MNVWLLLLLMCGLLVVLILTLFWHPQRFRTKTSIFEDRGRTDDVYRDDDRYWYGGVFYNNPADASLFVPKRYGLGWTMNFGHPQSKLSLIGILLLLLLFAILPVFISGTAPTGCHSFGCHP